MNFFLLLPELVSNILLEYRGGSAVESRYIPKLTCQIICSTNCFHLQDLGLENWMLVGDTAKDAQIRCALHWHYAHCIVWRSVTKCVEIKDDRKSEGGKKKKSSTNKTKHLREIWKESICASQVLHLKKARPDKTHNGEFYLS